MSTGILQRAILILISGLISFSVPVLAAEVPSMILVIHDGQFQPGKLMVPSGVKIKLMVKNQDDLPAEFESYELSREVIVPAHKDVSLYIGPLDPGSYPYFNDLNHAMTGSVVVEQSGKKVN
jgi:hypothetical protein